MNVTDGAGLPLGVEAGTQSFTRLTGTENPFAGVDFSFFPMPTTADVDGDGDPDLAVGTIMFEVQTLRNDGSVFTYLYGADNPLAMVRADGSPFISPAAIDLDGDGDLD